MEFKKELIRKSLHLPGLIFLFLAKDHKLLSLSLLGALILLYFLSWFLSRHGSPGIPGISQLTRHLRRQDSLDWGPPFLAAGLFITIAFFSFTAAACGILQACVADGAAAVVGKGWGTKKIFYSPKKSYLGTLAFFIAAFLIQLPFVSWQASLLLTLFGALLESLPFGAFDNLLIPIVAAFVQQHFLS